MNTDIRVTISFRGHRKRRKLSARLGQEATGYLIDLWIKVATDCPSGRLIGWDEADIAEAANWRGDPAQLTEALVKEGWLDGGGEQSWYIVHDWEEHQPWVVGAQQRSASARKAARTKWDRLRAAQPLPAPCATQCGPPSEQHSEPQCESDAERNAPYLTLPNHNVVTITNVDQQEHTSAAGPSEPSQQLLTLGEETTEAPATKQDRVPYAQILAMYQELCPGLIHAISLSNGRKAAIKARWAEYPGLALASFRKVFEKAQASDFLTGRREGSTWRADLGWLLKPERWLKTLEGGYDNRQNGGDNGQTRTFNAGPDNRPGGRYGRAPQRIPTGAELADSLKRAGVHVSPDSESEP